MIPVVIAAVFAAGAFDDTFASSVDAYRDGDYNASIRLLEQLAQENVIESVVYFNLANAYYRRGELGPAIANYERALQLEPGMDDARDNLYSAIERTERALPKPLPPEWERALLFWHEGLRPGTSFRWAAVCWVLAWGCLGIRQFRPVPYVRVAASVFGVMAVIFAASWWAKTHPQELAVAKDSRVPVRYGTHNSETIRFELYEGDRVSVDGREGSWVRVRAADGERGWVKSDSLIFVGAPFADFRSQTTVQAGMED